MKTKLLFLKLKATHVFLLSLMLYSFISMGSIANAQTVAGDYTFSYVTGSTYSSLSGGITIAPDKWDDLVANAALGFNFYFNGSTYTSCYINANGYITFGTTAPANNEYYPISSTTPYNGAVAAFARDLYYGRDDSAYRIRYKTTGPAGNQVFTVQWRDVRRWNLSGKFNFQIKLYEGSNTVEVHYGPNSDTSDNTNLPVQVGLRGASNSDFNNRTTTTNWATTTVGSANSSTNSTTDTVRPVSNTIYRWTLTKYTASIPLYGSGTWTAPCGPTQITVEAWGAGGAGGKATVAGPNGGGGGGAYSKKTFTVTAGDSFAYTVGSGGSGYTGSRDGSDSWFGAPAFLLAKAGKGVYDDKLPGGLGGKAAAFIGDTTASIGDITYSGGNGGTPPNSSSHSGGGGGAAKVNGDGSNGGVNAGGASAFPGGAGGKGAKNDDGIFNLGYGSGTSGSNYGGGGGGARAALGWVDQNGGNGAPGYMVLSYSYPNTGAPPPVTAISVLSSDPTTDIGCVNNSVTLQASGGNTGAGVSTLWVKGAVCPTFAYIQEFMGSTYSTSQTTVGNLNSGNRTFTSTGANPYIDMQTVLTSPITPTVHKYMIIRYRVVSGVGGSTQIYIKKNGVSGFPTGNMVSAPLNSDGNWHIMNIDMTGNAAWSNSGGTITGWRFDYATANGTVMDIDYLALSSLPILENTNGDDTQITVDASDENTVFRSLRIADQAALCNGTIPYTSCIPVTLHRSDKTFIATADNNWDNASNWSFAGIPDNSNCVFVNNSKNLLVNTPFAAAKSIHVASNSSVTITTDNALTVTNSITNLGNGSNFLVESDANLIQIDDTAVNTGNIKLLRDSKMKRLDYIYWGTPVEGQVLRTFSPKTVASRFYSYNESDDTFSIITTLSNPMIKGQGYVIRAPNDFTTALQPWSGIFTGKPTNGVVNVTVTKSITGAGKNLVGNPYPSNIDLEKLTLANSATANGVYYFWTNTNIWNSNNQPTPNGSNGNYAANNYATYNSSGGVAAAGGSVVPTKIVKPGQGFLYEAKASGSLIFSNDIRSKDLNDIFFSNRNGSNKEGATPERYWLKLTNAAGNFNTLLVAYIEGATNSFESRFDAKFPVASSDQFYSISDNTNLIIQGRQYPFVDTDVVPLGMSNFVQGTYSIALSDKEGLFNKGQSIYLKDKQTGTVTNLNQASYTFTANEGVIDTRFEIIYKPETVLVTDAASKEGVVVYRDGNDFVINSPKIIKTVEVYDLGGRMIAALKPNSKQGILNASRISNGIYVLKIISTDGEITNKKISR